VAREPVFKYKHFEDSPYRGYFKGGEIKLDVVVTRQPGINLPHYVYRGQAGSGIETLEDLAVISELKVSSRARDLITQKRCGTSGSCHSCFTKATGSRRHTE
jgi:hypothetical protein